MLEEEKKVVMCITDFRLNIFLLENMEFKTKTVEMIQLVVNIFIRHSHTKLFIVKKLTI
jgi:hypothetical protein